MAENLKSCPVCAGEGWVCENHVGLPWNIDGCQCGAGQPCVCNERAAVKFDVVYSSTEQSGISKWAQ